MIQTAGVKGRDIACKVTNATMSVGLKGKPPIIKVQGLSISERVSERERERESGFYQVSCI